MFYLYSYRSRRSNNSDLPTTPSLHNVRAFEIQHLPERALLARNTGIRMCPATYATASEKAQREPPVSSMPEWFSRGLKVVTLTQLLISEPIYVLTSG